MPHPSTSYVGAVSLLCHYIFNFLSVYVVCCFRPEMTSDFLCTLFCLFVCNSITDCYPRSGRIICCCVSTNLMFAVPICSFGSDRLSHSPSPVLQRKRITILVSMCQNYKLNYCVSVVKPRPPTSSHRNSLPDLMLLAREEECRAYDKGPSARHFNECFKLLHSFRIISGRAFF